MGNAAVGYKPAQNAAVGYGPAAPDQNYLASILQGYLDRTRNAAAGGLDMANSGAQAVQGGDLSGLLGMFAGPAAYVASPITGIFPDREFVERGSQAIGRNVGVDPTLAAAVGLGALDAAGLAAPGPKGLKMEARAAEAVPEGITAYHGSPHTFDKFDMSKIGTGEGAQAYGHGLYFAENEGVAKGYRDTITNSGNAGAQKRLQQAGGNVDQAIADARAKAEKYRAGGADSYASAVEEDLRFLEDHKRQGGWAPGSMYQVRLNVKPDELLDWDKPLHEQPESVRAVYRKTLGAEDPAALQAKLTDIQSRKEALAKDRLPSNVMRDEKGWHALANQADAVQAQLAAAKSGQHFYEAVGQKSLRDSKTFGNVAEFNARSETAQQLKAAGIKGIRYKDAGSRSAEGGTYNYVIFDDKIIDILKRYGIPITAGAGGAAIVSGANMPPDVAAQLGPQG